MDIQNTYILTNYPFILCDDMHLKMCFSCIILIIPLCYFKRFPNFSYEYYDDIIISIFIKFQHTNCPIYRVIDPSYSSVSRQMISKHPLRDGSLTTPQNPVSRGWQLISQQLQTCVKSLGLWWARSACLVLKSNFPKSEDY